MTKKILIALLAVACAKASSKENPPPAKGDAPLGDTEVSLDDATAGLPKEGKLMAEIQTDMGSINCELFPQSAPKTVASFVSLARGLRPWRDPATHQWKKSNFFDGLAFHRVIPKFMIQGGDPKSRDYSADDIGSGGPGYTLPDEIDQNLKFDRPGRLAMANTGPHTHSGGSQFFVTEVPYPSLDGGYVIFGQCDNPEVEQAIARVPVGEANRPVKPVTMKVRIYKK